MRGARVDRKERKDWKLTIEDFEKAACYRDHGDYRPIAPQ
jgi:hypothetical protein